MKNAKFKRMKDIDTEFQPESKKTFLEEHKMAVEFKILETIINYPGIGTMKLADDVGINRKNLGQYLKKLITRRYVRKDEGHHGKYFPGEDLLRNSVVSSRLLAEMFASKILGQPNIILSYPPFSDMVDFRTLLPYFQKEEFGLLRSIFEFTNKVGAYMTYVIIQAMNPANEPVRDWKHFRTDSIIQDWLSISIVPILRQILVEFKNSLRLELDSLVGDKEDPYGPFIKYEMNTPEFQLNKEVIDEISLAYSRLYPIMYTELEKVRKNMPVLIHSYRNHLEYLEIQDMYQKTCEHNYESDVPRLIEYEGRRFWTKYDKSVVHCKNCHHTTYRKYIK